MLLKGAKNLPFLFLFLLELPEGQDTQMWMVYSLIYTELLASEEMKEYSPFIKIIKIKI